MKEKTLPVSLTLLIFFALTFPCTGKAATNSSSRFLQARQPASQLDLDLLGIEQQWRYSIIRNSDYFNAIAPLVVRLRVFVHCYYNPELDKIMVTGFISNDEDFFHLTLLDRKELLKQTLNLFLGFLSSKVSYAKTGKPVDIKDLKLELVLNNSPPSTRGTLKDCGLPNGQAGFVDGKLVFSEELYLTIRSEKAWKAEQPLKDTIIMIPYKPENR